MFYFLRFKFLVVLCTACLFKDIAAQTTTISGTVNLYTPVNVIDTTNCQPVIHVANSAGFFTGDTVLIIQMKGADFDSSNTTSFGAVNNLRGAGNYEITRISAINVNTITLTYHFVNVYRVSGYVQLVRVKNYTNANVNAVLTCPPWNGLTGGVLIFNVANVLTLNANIDVKGKGFRGGTVSMNPDGGCGTGSPGYYYPLNPGGFSWSVGGAQKGKALEAFPRLSRRVVVPW